MAVTRAKAKRTPPIDWEDKKEIHDNILEAFQNEEYKLSSKKLKGKEKVATSKELEDGKSAALFEQLMETPTTLTWD